MEAALHSNVEDTSWMVWWTFAMRPLALKSTDDGRLVHRLSLAGARYQLLIAKTALTLWANIILKRMDAVLAKVKDSMSFESFMVLRYSKISVGNKLFRMDVLNQAIEKASKILHNEAIWKTVTCDKPFSHGKKFQFLTMPQKQQGPQSKKPTRSASGSSFCQSSAKSSSSKASSSSSHWGKGKKF